MSSHEMTSALSDLYRAGPLHWDKLNSMPQFEALKALCVQHYGLTDDGMGMQSALAEVLQTVGAPFWNTKDTGAWSDDLDTAAKLFDQAFQQTRAQINYLCPLDLADDLPALAFGTAQVRRFEAAELKDLFQEGRLKRHQPRAVVEWNKLAEFHWLVVEDQTVLPASPGERAVPILYQHFDKDFGAIDPHKQPFPALLHDVIFFLASAPWQDWVSWKEFDWRGFAIPWHYEASGDLLSRPRQPPSHETLTWEPHIYQDRYGDEIEIERPAAYPLEDTQDIAATLSDANWRACQRARQSPVFSPPVAHFLVRGLMSKDIDEFLAHITTIEAALGAPTDFVMKGRKGQRHKDMKATARVAARLAGALGLPEAEGIYQALFKIRSDFLHGTWTGPIPSEQRMQARHLAQRVVSKLIAHGTSAKGAVARDAFLSDLLDIGSPNT